MGNQSRTAFFQKIAEQIHRDRTRISWIVVNEDQRKALLSDGFGEEDILYLPLSTPPSGETYPIKINDLVFCDRRLMHMRQRGLDYLRAIQAPIVEFLDTDLPTLVVGELTYAYEVLTHRLVRNHLPNAEWVSPFLTRVPAGFFAFFADEAFSREVWPVPRNDGPTTIETGDASDELSYLEMNHQHIARQGSMSFLREKIGRFLSLEDFDPEDPTWKSNRRRDKLAKNARWWLNRRSYARVPKVGIEAIEVCRGRSVIYPLHLQPELNIDTCGRYWDNQAETILKIWRQLGPDDALFIKEHPVAVGNRGRAWYERLLAYPNLHLLHHAVPVPQVLKKIDYVFTISGTMGLESALAGGKVLCLAPTTYDRLENVVSPTIADFRRCGTIDDLYDTLRGEKQDGWSLANYAAHLERFAYPGDAEGDLIANPASWEPRNFARVAWAFEQVLDQVSASQK
ncbi:capsular polysaccharide export protein, LipB/KpsS family [Erythrobacter sp. Dej080120_24]|uniref:capsular polysaccharide export protein, LipB/KpsS family n=1 Tax=Erythrobacter sp. Dej080120_24 TaxID=3024837 RepID=UPI0030C7419F